jgi:hypothetical protein
MLEHVRISSSILWRRCGLIAASTLRRLARLAALNASSAARPPRIGTPRGCPLQIHRLSSYGIRMIAKCPRTPTIPQIGFLTPDMPEEIGLTSGLELWGMLSADWCHRSLDQG